MRRASARTDRAASWLLGAHGALIVFSTIALTTLLAEPPAWLAQEPNVTIMKWAFRLSGPSYVLLGAAAALLHASGRIGTRAAISLLAVAGAVSLTAELIGTGTGYPFGSYAYTPLLGYRVGGRVPFPIPVSWFYMLYASLAICARVLPAGDSLRDRTRWALAAGLALTAWDVSMDPAMVRTNHWLWLEPARGGAWGWFATGVFHGMPWSNWFGWWLTGSAIAFLMLLLVRPTRWRDAIATSDVPLWLYAVNGIMPVAICARYGMWDAALPGAIAMAVPLRWAIARGRSAAEPSAVPASALAVE